MSKIAMLLAAVTLTGAVGLAAHAQPSAGAAPPTPDFIVAASQTDAYERSAGQLAQTKGKANAVRSFGAMMVRDHAKTTTDLQAAIRKSGMQPPPPPPLRPDQQQMLDQLNSAQGDFDSVYAMQQVQVHTEALALMQGYAAGGDDKNIQKVAAKAAPIVQHHLQMAQALSGG